MNYLVLALLTTALCPVDRAVAMSFPPPASQQPQAALPTPRTPFAGLIAAYLQQSLAGHSPTADDISGIASLKPSPTPDAVREALPYLLRALEAHDPATRTFALTAILGTAEQKPVPGKDDSAPIFSADTIQALLTAIPDILTHLTDDTPENRTLTVTFLSAFAGRAPAALFPPVFAYLKTPDALSTTGLGVTIALLNLGPVSADTSAALVKFLRRSDQRALRSELVDIIANAPNQSRDLNAGLLTYLSADDPGLRARLILSLPVLDLGPDAFADAKYRVDILANNDGENLQVVTAAKAVSACWVAAKMPSGCPVY